MNEKIQEWYNLVNSGLVNGLSYTNRDKRLDDIDFWVKRCRLFDAFAHCVLNLETGQDWQYSEKDLREIASEGYRND